MPATAVDSEATPSAPLATAVESDVMPSAFPATAVDKEAVVVLTPPNAVESEATPLVFVAIPVDTVVDRDVNCSTLTASFGFTPSATPEMTRGPWPPEMSKSRPGEVGASLILPVVGSWERRPTPASARSLETEVDRDVSCDIFTASVGLTPAARPLSSTPPGLLPSGDASIFDIVRTFPSRPPVRNRMLPEVPSITIWESSAVIPVQSA
ncbi:hypothetical protein WT55_18780 [Burkholderia pseudomultivorans]|nr:hypothetical protein WT55_18780 [Burkholderia pseudomultivorans]